MTPCMECGADDFELDHYKEHDYKEYELYFGQKLVLCDFCDVDFGSYDPAFFGFPTTTQIGYQDFNYIKDISDKNLRKGKYCPKCSHSLKFLKFVDICRQKNKLS